jgi:hypothetical protein
MAASSLPDALLMRELRAGNAPEAERERVAAELRAQGRATQAVLLYEGRAQHPALDAEQARAVREGHVFLLLAMRRLGRSVPDADLRAAAQVASTKGGYLEARLAYQALGDVEAVRALAPHLPPSLVPPPPPPPPAAISSSH